MIEMELDALKYPLGKWHSKAQPSADDIKGWIDDIRHLPGQLRELLTGLPDTSLVYRYRPGGWNLRQLIHHIADSHVNAYIRHKLAVTENEPRISPYQEGSWAELEDVLTLPIGVSLQLLESLHLRWTVFLESLDATQLQSTFFHPQSQKVFRLHESISMYSWHGRHHLEHVRNALKQPY